MRITNLGITSSNGHEREGPAFASSGSGGNSKDGGTCSAQINIGYRACRQTVAVEGTLRSRKSLKTSNVNKNNNEGKSKSPESVRIQASSGKAFGMFESDD